MSTTPDPPEPGDPPEPAPHTDRGAQLTALRSEAVTRLHGFDEAIAQLRADRSADNADDEHDPEGVTLSSEWARLEGLRGAAERDLDDIDAALARHGEESDGVCVDCGRGIPPERLQVRPTATRCVQCAARAGV
ncbi:TraR/DksA family transcriptional regulator [Microbacterium sp. HJ5]